jgi:predicted amidohydrolase YtcJ
VAMPEETIARIVELGMPCCAMFTTRRFLAWNEGHGKDPMKTFHAVKDGNDRRLIEAGAVLLLTTDAGIFPPNVKESPLMGEGASAEDSPTQLGEAHYRWLQAAQELGMRPMDALMAATRNIARAYKVDSEIGTLEAGKRADLLVLERNPLEDAANYRSIRIVMKDGAVVRREALPLAPVLTAPRG